MSIAPPQPTEVEPFRFGPFLLEPQQLRLSREGQPLALQPKAMDVLICLVSRSGELVTREQLMEIVWPDVVVTDASLARSIRQLREVLGDDANQPRYIETVPKAGYRFIMETFSLSSGAQTPGHAKPWLLVAAGLVVAALIVALISLMPTRTGVPTVDAPAAADPSAGRPLDVTAINAERSFRMGEQALASRTVASLSEARAHFERALEQDPRHAAAMAGLALTLSLTSGRPPPADAQRRIMALANRAQSIQPNLALSHAAIGFMLMYFPRRYPEAEQSFRTAIELDPGLTEAYSGLSTLLLGRGEVKQAMDLKRRALSLNPGHSSLTANLAMSLGFVGRYEEAMELIDALDDVPEARPSVAYPRTVLLDLMGDQVTAAGVQMDALEGGSLFAARDLAGRLIKAGSADEARGVIARIDRIGETCETIETRFLRETGLRLALGGEAMDWVQEHRDLLPMFEDKDSALLWMGRLAIAEGDLDGGIDALLALFPSPDMVTGWQGSILQPADAAQYLAWALLRQGRGSEAVPYLNRIARQIEQRWSSGFQRHHPLTLLEARNRALQGEPDRAIDLIHQALDWGWVDMTWVDDPRWESLVDSPRYLEIVQRVSRRAGELRAGLMQNGIQERLQAAIAAVPDGYLPPCPDSD